MTGVDLAIELHKLRPQLPVILLSGVIGDSTLKMAKNAGISEVIMKPVPPVSFAHLIHRTLHVSSQKLDSEE
jgi:FixJ family two-component response regulator